MGDFNWKFPPGTKYSGRSIQEIYDAAREEFYKANGYYPTPEDAVRLTDEARKEIALEKNLNRSFLQLPQQNKCKEQNRHARKYRAHKAY